MNWSLAQLWHHRPAAYDAAFSSDGRRLACMDSQASLVTIRDSMNGSPILGPLAHPDFTFGVAFHPKEELLVTTCADRRIRLWSSVDGRLMRTLTGHVDGVRSIRFSADGRRMTSASLDNTIRIWDSQHWLPLSEYLTGHGGSNISVAEFVDKDRRLLAFSNMSKGLTLWPVEQPPLPPPAWILELAELLTGANRTDWRVGDTSHVLRLIKLLQVLRDQKGDDYYSRWGRWFAADRSSRDPFPP